MARNAGVPGAGAKMWNDNKRYSAPPPRNWPWHKKYAHSERLRNRISERDKRFPGYIMKPPTFYSITPITPTVIEI